MFSGDLSIVQNGLTHLASKLGFEITADGQEVQILHTGQDLTITKTQNKMSISFAEPAHFYRGLALLINHWEDTEYHLQETPNFKQIGPMVDTSRNAVPTVQKIKEILQSCSIMGLNQINALYGRYLRNS